MGAVNTIVFNHNDTFRQNLLSKVPHRFNVLYNSDTNVNVNYLNIIISNIGKTIWKEKLWNSLRGIHIQTKEVENENISIFLKKCVKISDFFSLCIFLYSKDNVYLDRNLEIKSDSFRYNESSFCIDTLPIITTQNDTYNVYRHNTVDTDSIHKNDISYNLLQIPLLKNKIELNSCSTCSSIQKYSIDSSAFSGISKNEFDRISLNNEEEMWKLSYSPIFDSFILNENIENSNIPSTVKPKAQNFNSFGIPRYYASNVLNDLPVSTYPISISNILLSLLRNYILRDLFFKKIDNTKSYLKGESFRLLVRCSCIKAIPISYYNGSLIQDSVTYDYNCTASFNFEEYLEAAIPCGYLLGVALSFHVVPFLIDKPFNEIIENIHVIEEEKILLRIRMDTLYLKHKDRNITFCLEYMEFLFNKNEVIYEFDDYDYSNYIVISLKKFVECITKWFQWYCDNSLDLNLHYDLSESHFEKFLMKHDGYPFVLAQKPLSNTFVCEQMEGSTLNYAGFSFKDTIDSLKSRSMLLQHYVLKSIHLMLFDNLYYETLINIDKCLLYIWRHNNTECTMHTQLDYYLYEYIDNKSFNRILTNNFLKKIVSNYDSVIMSCNSGIETINFSLTLSMKIFSFIHNMFHNREKDIDITICYINSLHYIGVLSSYLAKMKYYDDCSILFSNHSVNSTIKHFLLIISELINKKFDSDQSILEQIIQLRHIIWTHCILHMTKVTENYQIKASIFRDIFFFLCQWLDINNIDIRFNNFLDKFYQAFSEKNNLFTHKIHLLRLDLDFVFISGAVSKLISELSYIYADNILESKYQKPNIKQSFTQSGSLRKKFFLLCEPKIDFINFLEVMELNYSGNELDRLNNLNSPSNTINYDLNCDNGNEIIDKLDDTEVQYLVEWLKEFCWKFDNRSLKWNIGCEKYGSTSVLTTVVNTNCSNTDEVINLIEQEIYKSPALLPLRKISMIGSVPIFLVEDKLYTRQHNLLHESIMQFCLLEHLMP